MLIPYLIVIFLASCVLSILYWQVIQPVALKGIQFRLFARRDELRRLAIDGKADFTSFPYREAEGFICKTIAIVPSVSLLSFISFVIGEKEDKEDFARFRKEASPALILLMHKTAGDGLLILFLNSPIIALASLFVALILWVAGKINRYVIYRKAEDFIDDLPNDDSSRLPQAA